MTKRKALFYSLAFLFALDNCWPGRRHRESGVAVGRCTPPASGVPGSPTPKGNGQEHNMANLLFSLKGGTHYRTEDPRYLKNVVLAVRLVGAKCDFFECF